MQKHIHIIYILKFVTPSSMCVVLKFPDVEARLHIHWSNYIRNFGSISEMYLFVKSFYPIASSSLRSTYLRTLRMKALYHGYRTKALYHGYRMRNSLISQSNKNRNSSHPGLARMYPILEGRIGSNCEKSTM